MKILVFELACSRSGFESSVVYEGFEMLKLIVNGFMRAGHEVTTILNSAVFKFAPELQAKDIIKVENSENLTEKIIDIFNQKNIDCVFPIAPDYDLFEIAGKLRLLGIEVIASENKALEIARDKWKTYEALKCAKINTPKTRLFAGEPMDYSFIIKPRTGIACENLFKINNENEFKIISKDNNFNNNFIIQEFVKGDDASVTLFSDGKHAVPASLNRQNLKLSAKDSKYIGGIVPYEHPLKDKAFETAKSAVESISGLKGAVGVDLVLSDKPYVIEINPRVTTSMAALEKVSNLNVAESALLAYKGKLPEIPEVKFKNKNIIEFSHVFDDEESLGIEFKEIKK